MAQIEELYSQLLWETLRSDGTENEVELTEPQKTEGVLARNDKNDRYGLLVGKRWVCRGFRCGAVIEVWQDGQWVSTQVEYDGNWYLAGTVYRGNLDGIKARI